MACQGRDYLALAQCDRHQPLPQLVAADNRARRRLGSDWRFGHSVWLLVVYLVGRYRLLLTGWLRLPIPGLVILGVPQAGEEPVRMLAPKL
jgi:hypothetical protein